MFCLTFKRYFIASRNMIPPTNKNVVDPPHYPLIIDGCFHEWKLLCIEFSCSYPSNHSSYRSRAKQHESTSDCSLVGIDREHRLSTNVLCKICKETVRTTYDYQIFVSKEKVWQLV